MLFWYFRRYFDLESKIVIAKTLWTREVEELLSGQMTYVTSAKNDFQWLSCKDTSLSYDSHVPLAAIF